MVYIYVLECQNKKFYIGKTFNPSFRLQDHFNINGSAWTKKHKPIKLHELKPDQDDEDEDKITIQYMKKHGINNVRGGSFCQIKLNDENSATLNRMIKGTSDKCYNCGGDHFINVCPNKNKKVIRCDRCDRCDRIGHTYDKCYATTYNDGTHIDNEREYDRDEETSDEEVWLCQYCDKEFDTEKGCRFHENIHCKMKNKKKSVKCFKCGKRGHYANNCYSNDCIFD